MFENLNWWEIGALLVIALLIFGDKLPNVINDGLRMLRNLRLGYMQNEAWDKALRCTDRIVTLDPFAVAEFRERGNLYLKLEHHRAARDDFRRYLALAPQAEDAEAVMNLLIASSAKAERLH